MVCQIRYSGPLLFAMLCVATHAALGAEPAPEKPVKQLLEERSKCLEQFQRFLEEKKLPEAIAAAEQVARLERQLLARAERDTPDDEQALARWRGELAGSLEWLGDQYLERGDFAAAIKARKELVPLAAKVLGEKHWQVTDARLALADVERLAAMTAEQRRQLAEAERLNGQVLQLQQQGKFADALPLARKAKEAGRQLVGQEHLLSAQLLNNLAELYRSMGAYARAERLYQEALEIGKEVLGEKHPNYALSLHNLAALYQSMGAYARAEPLYQQAREIQKEALGEKHPHYATTLSKRARQPEPTCQGC